MKASRTLLIDTSTAPRLRAGIKWDPLEGDDIAESYGLDSAKQARIKRRALALKIRGLVFCRTFFRLARVFKSVRHRLDRAQETCRTEIRNIDLFLKHDRLLSFDLDLCCFCYGMDGALIGVTVPDNTQIKGVNQWHPAFVHSGNDRTGTGDAFDEELLLDLAKVDPDIHRIFFVILSRNHGFHKIKGGSWSLFSTKNEKELFFHAIKTEETAQLHAMADVVREGEDKWRITELADYLPLDNKKGHPLRQKISAALFARYIKS